MERFEDDIERRTQEIYSDSEIVTVVSAKIEIDKAQNYFEYKLEYKNEHARDIIMVNIKSTSLIALYNKFKASGLFDMNRGNFCFLNNGIVIACKDFMVDGNKIILTNFLL